jgi:UDP-glucose 4-epimerase
MTSILITGGAGYIGSHIVEQLIKSDEKVVILDNLVTGHIKLINKKAKFIKADIKNKSQIISIIRDNNITSIIHLAAYLNISEAEKNKKEYFKNCI